MVWSGECSTQGPFSTGSWTLQWTQAEGGNYWCGSGWHVNSCGASGARPWSRVTLTDLHMLYIDTPSLFFFLCITRNPVQQFQISYFQSLCEEGSLMSFLKLLEVTATECWRFFLTSCTSAHVASGLVGFWFISCLRCGFFLLLLFWSLKKVFDYYFCRWTYTSRASS